MSNISVRRLKTFEAGFTASSQVANANEIVALYALMGGYNAVARNVPLEKYKQIKERFDSVLVEMIAAMATP